jgi:hypothetical protein
MLIKNLHGAGHPIEYRGCGDAAHDDDLTPSLKTIHDILASHLARLDIV